MGQLLGGGYLERVLGQARRAGPMRLVVDASAAASGGLAKYVRCLLTAWSNGSGSEDELHLVASKEFASSVPDCFQLHTTAPGVTSRLRLQYEVVSRAVSRTRPDALLSTLPLVPLR